MHRCEEWTLVPPECEPAERIGFRVETLQAFGAEVELAVVGVELAVVGKIAYKPQSGE